MAYRLILPVSLTGTILLLLPIIWALSAWLFLLYLPLIGLIGYCGVLNAVLATGVYRLLAATVGLLLTVAAGTLAFGLFIASGGV